MPTPTDKVMTDAAEKYAEETNKELVTQVGRSLAEICIENSKNDYINAVKSDFAREYWQQQLSPASSGAGVWVNAAQRFPKENIPESLDDVTFRVISNKRPVSDIWKFYSDKIELENGSSICGEEIKYSEIEWLDESPQSSSMVSEDEKRHEAMFDAETIWKLYEDFMNGYEGTVSAKVFAHFLILINNRSPTDIQKEQ